MRAHALVAAAAAALLACTGASTDHGTRSSSATDRGTASTAPRTAPRTAAGSAGGQNSGAAATAYQDWYTYHGGPKRSGYAKTQPTPHGTPKLIHDIKLDGAVYAAPLVVKNVTIVATENNTVYAWSSHYQLLWKRHLGSPSPAAQRPCGNIDPLGITGTPVYVASTGTVYVAAEFSGNPPTHRLYALRFSTGSVRWSHTLDFSGVDARAMQQRGALLATSAGVYVPFGGLAGDCGNYKGRVVRWALDGSGSAAHYTVPTAREAGIWTPPGPSYDGTSLYVAVGNGAATGGSYDGSDSVLKLAKTSLTRQDYFAPSNWASENSGDVDLGSQGPTIVGNWIFQAGKSGTAYVLRRSSLGHIGGQVSSASVCRSFGGTAVVGSTVYVPCTDGVRAVSVSSTGHMSVQWHAAGNVTGSPVVGGHRVWVLDPGGGKLYALSTTDGHAITATTVGTANRFATPAMYGHRVIVGTLRGFSVVEYS